MLVNRFPDTIALILPVPRACGLLTKLLDLLKLILKNVERVARSEFSLVGSVNRKGSRRTEPHVSPAHARTASTTRRIAAITTMAEGGGSRSHFAPQLSLVTASLGHDALTTTLTMIIRS